MTATCFFSLGLSGCSYFLGSKSKPPPLEIKQGNETCLTELKANMKSWSMTGQPSMGFQIECLVRGIDQFSEKTSGRGDGWSRGELVGFFDTYFPARDGSSSSLWIDEILKLKQSWFAGNTDRLTRAELTRIRRFLQLVKPDLEKISPLAPRLFLRDRGSNQADSAVVQEVQVIKDSLQSVATTIIAAIERTGTARPHYDVDSLLNLLYRLGCLKEKTDRLLNVSEAVKTLLTGGSGRAIEAQDWPRVLNAAARVWTLAVRFRYELEKSGSDFLRAEPFGLETLELLTNAIEAQESTLKGIPIKKFAAVFNALADKNGVIGIGGEAYRPRYSVRASTLTDLLGKFFGKILFGVARTDDAEMARNLTPENLETLRAYFGKWRKAQVALAKVYGDQDALTPREIVDALAEMGLEPELARLLGQGRPLTRDDEGQVVVGPSNTVPKMSRAVATFYNAVRTVVSAIFAGYSHRENQPGAEIELTSQEIEEIYWDARDLGIDFNVTDVRNKNSGSRTFLEASLFTSVSRGGKTVNVGEITEWFHLALGANLLGEKIYLSIPETCWVDAIDIFGRQKMNTVCFRENFWPNLRKNLPNLPRLVTWYENASSKDQAAFQTALEGAGRGRGSRDDFPLDSSELRSMIPILHYTESLLTNHDADLDGMLNTEEVWKSFPIFKNLIGQVSEQAANSEFLQRTVFSYLLTFGAPPSPNLFGTTGFLAWSVAKSVWRETADRLKVLNVIASFSILGRQKKQVALETFIVDGFAGLRPALEDGNPAYLMKFAESFGCRTSADPLIADDLRKEAVEILNTEMGQDASVFIQELKRRIASQIRFESKCEAF